jgi:hypothetical protein
MELKVGMTFTSSEECFNGRVEVLEIDEPNNRLRVSLTKKNDTFNSNWNEDWNLQHTIWGFERGDYFVKNFTDYPQDLQRSAEQQCDIADVSLSVCDHPEGYRGYTGTPNEYYCEKCGENYKQTIL